MPAVRTGAAWHPQVVARRQAVFFGRLVSRLAHFQTPCAFEHDRHSMHDDVQEAADDEPEYDRKSKLQGGRQAAECLTETRCEMIRQQVRKRARKQVGGSFWHE